MDSEEKNRNESLSRIAAGLFAKSKGSEELSSTIRRLRDELKKLIEGEDTIFGKFRGLLESFREIIPEESQRYNAAIKALSTTSKVSRQEIIKAASNQLEELKILEKGLLGAPYGWRGELKVMEAKARERRDEISKLREKIVLLEREEKELLNGMAAREKDLELVSKAVEELFADIAAEITRINKKVQEVTAENTATQPILPGDVKSDIFNGKKGGDEQKSEIRGSSAPQQNTEFQKKCPMCGGQMNFHGIEKMWKCYSCAYEESSQEGEGQDTSEETSNRTNAPTFAPVPVSEPIFDSSPPAVPLESLSSSQNQEPIKGSIERAPPPQKQPSPKKKTCPACHKKMNWHEEEETWRCPFCQ